MGRMPGEFTQPVEGKEEIVKEICICAAIKLEDGTLIRGQRHGDAIETALRRCNLDIVQMMSRPYEQGFITSSNKFVSRREGYALQIMAGIESIAEGGYRGDQLFSEDLY
jgi:hypothetical protein